jgi:hypothetical protein
MMDHGIWLMLIAGEFRLAAIEGKLRILTFHTSGPAFAIAPVGGAP